MKKFKTISEIIDHYLKNGYRHQQLELGLYSIDDTPGLVSGYTPCVNRKGKLTRIWCCGDNYNIIDASNLVHPAPWPHPHQWWMSRKVEYRRKASMRIQERGVLTKSFSNFEELYDYLRNEVKITRGKLYCYDLARRIGYCRGINPAKFVYLHEGAEKGAKTLEEMGFLSLPKNWEIRVPAEIFDPVFPNIPPIDIENILCIYDKVFKTIEKPFITK